MKKGERSFTDYEKEKQTGKIMAMALTAAMLGGMLAGCGNNAANAPADTTPAPETQAAESSAVQGEYACRGNTGCKRRAGDH